MFLLVSLNFLKSSPENATYLLENIKISTTLLLSLKIRVCAVSLLKNFRVLNIARKRLINIYLLRRITYVHFIICPKIHFYISIPNVNIGTNLNSKDRKWKQMFYLGIAKCNTLDIKFKMLKIFPCTKSFN